jgi:hypothetical protein
MPSVYLNQRRGTSWSPFRDSVDTGRSIRDLEHEATSIGGSREINTATTETLVINLIVQHDPEPDHEFASDGDSRGGGIPSVSLSGSSLTFAQLRRGYNERIPDHSDEQRRYREFDYQQYLPPEISCKQTIAATS